MWKEHFKQCLTTEFPHDENILQFIPNVTSSVEPSTEELIITKEEVKKIMSSLKNNKTPGSDLIAAEVLIARRNSK